MHEGYRGPCTRPTAGQLVIGLQLQAPAHPYFPSFTGRRSFFFFCPSPPNPTKKKAVAACRSTARPMPNGPENPQSIALLDIIIQTTLERVAARSREATNSNEARPRHWMVSKLVAPHLCLCLKLTTGLPCVDIFDVDSHADEACVREPGGGREVAQEVGAVLFAPPHTHTHTTLPHTPCKMMTNISMGISPRKIMRNLIPCSSGLTLRAKRPFSMRHIVEESVLLTGDKRYQRLDTRLPYHGRLSERRSEFFQGSQSATPAG